MLGARRKLTAPDFCEQFLYHAFRGSTNDGCEDLIYALEVSVLEEFWVVQAEAEGAIESDVCEPDWLHDDAG
jgi:hypothetical protein